MRTLLPQITARATDPNAEIRAAALEGLGRIALPASLDILRTASEARDPETRAAALMALADVGSLDAVRYLLDRASRQPQDAQTIIDALGYVPTDAAVTGLVDLLGQHPDDVLTVPLLEALACQRDLRASDVVLTATKSRRALVRKVAATTLAKLNDPSAGSVLAELLTDTDLAVRIAALGALGEMPAPDAVKPLRALLGSDDPLIIQGAINALGVTRLPDVVPDLVRILQDPQMAVFHDQALLALWRINSKVALPAVVACMKGTNQLVRVRAAEVAGHIGGADAVPALEEMLHNDPLCRIAALNGLSNSRSPAALPAVIAALKEGDSRERQAALRALWKIGPTEEGYAAIEQAFFGTDDSRVKSEAARALAFGGHAIPQVLAFCRIGLTDPTPGRAMSCVSALIGLTGNEDAALLLRTTFDTKPDLRLTIARAIGRLRSGASDALLLDLIGENALSDYMLTSGVVDGVVEFQIDSVYQYCLKRLPDTDDLERRIYFTRIVAGLSDAQAEQVLLKMLADECFLVRVAAVQGLGRLTGPAVRDAILTAATADPCPDVRVAAVQSLSKEGHTGRAAFAEMRAHEKCGRVLGALDAAMTLTD